MLDKFHQFVSTNTVECSLLESQITLLSSAKFKTLVLLKNNLFVFEKFDWPSLFCFSKNVSPFVLMANLSYARFLVHISFTRQMLNIV